MPRASSSSQTPNDRADELLELLAEIRDALDELRDATRELTREMKGGQRRGTPGPELVRSIADAVFDRFR